MNILCLFVAVFCCARGAAVFAAEAPSPAAAPLRVVAYVPNWIDLAAFAETIDYAKVTHLNVAFENPTNAEGDLSFSKKDEALLAKAREAGVKVLVSMGGGSAAEDAKLLARFAALLGEAKRAQFAAKLADYVVAHHFDGLDVDLEGRTITADYGAFIAELAPLLRARGRLLTAALSQGFGGDQVPAAALGLFDFVNVMAYDATGPWQRNKPGPSSSLEFAEGCVRYWLERGLAPERTVLGVPFYGYGFGAAFRTRDYPYAELLRDFPGAEGRNEVGNTIWYNGPELIRAKARLVRAQHLGGMMIWSLNLDAPRPASLLTVIDEELRK